MVTPRICLAQPSAPTSMTTFSLNRATSKHERFLSNQSKIHAPLHSINVSRREVAILLSLGILSAASLQRQPLPAFAFNLGISGPKDWLKEQKKKSIKFLLAPIDDSRETLRAAYLLLTNKGSDYQKEDLEEVQRLLRYSARDCVPDERNSFVAFQSKTGVEIQSSHTLPILAKVVNRASSAADGEVLERTFAAETESNILLIKGEPWHI